MALRPRSFWVYVQTVYSVTVSKFHLFEQCFYSITVSKSLGFFETKGLSALRSRSPWGFWRNALRYYGHEVLKFCWKKFYGIALSKSGQAVRQTAAGARQLQPKNDQTAARNGQRAATVPQERPSMSQECPKSTKSARRVSGDR